VGEVKRYLRFFWTLIQSAFGSHEAATRLRHGMATLNAIDGVMTPYRKGDYAAALEAAEGFRLDGEVSAPYCFYRGSCLAHLGRLPEAEVWLRRNIELRKSDPEKRHIAIGYTTLAHLMLQAGRYDEAVECIEASIRQFADRSSPYRSMAEVILTRGGDAGDALRWANSAIDKVNADQKASAELRKLTLGETLATQAWAIAAASHNAADVTRMTNEAVASAGSSSVSSTAQVLYHCARAFEELSDSARAGDYYQKLAALDVQGHFGRAARAALAHTVAG
jgi:tetratricopeptide (TPR) repeat protein